MENSPDETSPAARRTPSAPSAVLRAATLVIGTVGIATAAVADGVPWFAATFTVLALGSLAQLHRDRQRGGPIRRGQIVVTAVAVVLTVIALVSAAADLPRVLLWAGGLAFAIAWLDYLVDLGRRRSDG